MRWLHCSDFHIGKDRTAQERLNARIIDHVERKVKAGFIPDFVFITGDITNRGTKNEYSEFRNNFLAPIREVLGGNKWEGRILSVPGNHDVDRTKNENFDRLSPLKDSGQFFEANKLGKTKRDILSPRFKAYRQGAVADLSGDWISSSQGAFSEIFTINGVQTGVVGINTAWLSKDDHDQLKLTPGVELVEAALESIKTCKVRIVLGHHPMSWFNEEHARRLRALFGHHRVIYLHGHLHKAEGRQEDGAGNSFLAVQAGSAFQARDGEPWRNGLLWGEVDIASEQVKFAPYFWNPDNYDWPSETGRFPEIRRIDNSDWWAYPLPVTHSANVVHLTPPSGWEFLTVDTLKSKRREISIEEAERFFNGGEPDWGIALCSKIPRRSIVENLTNQVTSYNNRERPLLLLLTGPGGEGKSMVLRQTLADLIELKGDFNILWHTEEAAPIPLNFLSQLPAGRWIIATDTADLIARSLFEAITELHRQKRNDISFVLCSRDSDWRATKAESLEWIKHSDLRVNSLSGLTKNDAHLISKSWASFNSSVADSTTQEQITRDGDALYEATQHEAEVPEGSLLGGILTVRLGEGLRPHVSRLIDRLSEYQLPSGRTLLDAFAYISAMHSEGLNFMSRPVLAKALGCNSREIGQLVIVPLAKEAAVTGGSILLTRHRRIAEAAISVLRNEFGEDITRRFEELACAAKSARPTEFILDYAKWEFDLPGHFLDNDPDTSLRIASALAEADVYSVELAVNLASIYRGCNAPKEGADNLFRFKGEVGNNRSFWFEWSTCAGQGGDFSTSAILAGWSIADQAASTPPDIKRAKLSLAGLCHSLYALYEQYGDEQFIIGLNAVIYLGMQLPLDPATKMVFVASQARAATKTVTFPDNEIAFETLRASLISVWDVCDQKKLGAKIATPESFTYENICRLFNNISKS
ncbi:metallophosphoesterase family protein [Pseudomonas fluorescens]|uniref:metallophosphoesterase family protein n=1 Tax=Pseudomonas fluorescens TaxID=294 RepID=UPI0037489FEC